MDNAGRSKGRARTIADGRGQKLGRSSVFTLERAIGALISAQKVRARTPPHDFAKIARSLAELRKRGYIDDIVAGICLRDEWFKCFASGGEQIPDALGL